MPDIFVGRERELRALAGFLERTLAGQAQVAFVAGEAGVGQILSRRRVRAPRRGGEPRRHRGHRRVQRADRRGRSVPAVSPGAGRTHRRRRLETDGRRVRRDQCLAPQGVRARLGRDPALGRPGPDRGFCPRRGAPGQARDHRRQAEQAGRHVGRAGEGRPGRRRRPVPGPREDLRAVRAGVGRPQPAAAAHPDPRRPPLGGQRLAESAVPPPASTGRTAAC